MKFFANGFDKMRLELTALALQLPFVLHMMLKVHQRNFQNGECFTCTLVCHQLTLGHIGTVGLSPYISLVLPKIFKASGLYLKYFQRFKRKNQFLLRIEMTVLNV